MKAFTILIALLPFSLLNAAPVVSNLSAAQRADASKLVDIYYDVANPYTMNITLQVSNDNGATWAFSCALVSGDVGANISPGTGKHIVWDVLAEHPDISGNTYKFKVTADDGQSPPIPASFVYVPGGTFNPVTTYTVTLSAFYIDKFEVTQSGYQSVMGVNPATGYGIGDSFPVYYTTWFNAVEYCNRRSIQEGATPCYSYSTYGTNPNDWPAGWNTTNVNQAYVYCDWSADGYRLPTEMEWMFAARGGTQTHNYTYSGSNDVNSVAWYVSNSGGTSHLNGTKASNELGLYDMSGNVFEWVWDAYGDYPTGSHTDPRGPTPTTGSGRVWRGGSYNYSSTHCQVVTRMDNMSASWSSWYLGFRVCRRVP